MPDSALEYHIAKKGISSDWIATHLSNLIPPMGIVFDVGANVGTLSLPFAKAHAPQGLVYAFEPDDEARELLEKNISINKLTNILTLPYALQENPEKKSVTFHIREVVDGDWLTNKDAIPNIVYGCAFIVEWSMLCSYGKNGSIFST